MRTSGLLIVALLVSATFVTQAMAAPPPASTRALREAVTAAGVTEHLSAWETIAADNGGLVVPGTASHDAVVAYIRDRLEPLGYTITVQTLPYQFHGDIVMPEFGRVSPTPTTYVNGIDFRTLSYSGSADITAPIFHVMGAPDAGCEASDFAGFPAGSIALIERGTCLFLTKAQNALAVGATGVIIYNNGPGVFSGTLTQDVLIPVVGITQALGHELRAQAAGGPVVVHLETTTSDGTPLDAKTLVAQSPRGSPDDVVVGLAALDGYSGPESNQQSGAATLLEIAEIWGARGPYPQAGVRFVWYSNSGFGTYLAQLSEAERSQISFVLEAARLASPAGGRFVGDADNSEGRSASAAPSGSEVFEARMHEYFASQRLSDAVIAWDRVSVAAAASHGLPVGTLTGGDEVAHDPCRSSACDRVANLNNGLLEQMSDAVAHGLLTQARRP